MFTSPWFTFVIASIVLFGGIIWSIVIAKKK